MDNFFEVSQTADLCSSMDTFWSSTQIVRTTADLCSFMDRFLFTFDALKVDPINAEWGTSPTTTESVETLSVQTELSLASDVQNY